MLEPSKLSITDDSIIARDDMRLARSSDVQSSFVLYIANLAL